MKVMTKICKICEKEYEIYRNRSAGARGKIKRGKNTVCCSKKCTKINLILLKKKCVRRRETTSRRIKR